MTHWDDFYKDGLRLERIIKILFKHLKKTKSDENIVRLANSIAFLTTKKIEIARHWNKIDEIVKEVRRTKNTKKRIQPDPGTRYL